MQLASRLALHRPLAAKRRARLAVTSERAKVDYLPMILERMVIARKEAARLQGLQDEEDDSFETSPGEVAAKGQKMSWSVYPELQNVLNLTAFKGFGTRHKTFTVARLPQLGRGASGHGLSRVSASRKLRSICSISLARRISLSTFSSRGTMPLRFDFLDTAM